LFPQVAAERRSGWKLTGGGSSGPKASSSSHLIANIVPEQLGPLDKNLFDDDALFHGDASGEENENSDHNAPNTSHNKPNTDHNEPNTDQSGSGEQNIQVLAVPERKNKSNHNSIL
jgi:hypothetical protein